MLAILLWWPVMTWVRFLPTFSFYYIKCRYDKNSYSARLQLLIPEHQISCVWKSNSTFSSQLLKLLYISGSGVDRNFSRGEFSDFFLKNPSKLKNFWEKGGTNPPIPPSGYAPDFCYVLLCFLIPLEIQERNIKSFY